MQSGAGPSTRSRIVNKSTSIIESIRRERSVHVFMDASWTRSSMPREGARPSGDRCLDLTLTMSLPSDNVMAMLRPGTVAVVRLAVAAVVTVAVRETLAGVAPSPSALPRTSIGEETP